MTGMVVSFLYQVHSDLPLIPILPCNTYFSVVSGGQEAAVQGMLKF